MKTQYIPREAHGSIGLAFRRLEEGRLALEKSIALSHLFSWNYSAKLSAVRLEFVDEKPERARFWAHSPIEWLVAGLALTLALCACGEPERDDAIPEIAGPCPPGPSPVHVLGVHTLRDGSVAIILTK